MPIAISVSVYLFFRENRPTLLIGIFPIEPFKLSPALDWFVYNLPDGLWAFGFMSYLVISCHNNSQMTRVIYYALGIALMIGLEVSQGWLLPGTFDPKDLVAILVGAYLSWFALRFCLTGR